MKRFWLGMAVLALLLGAGILVTLGINGICRPISRQLEEASGLESWEAALSLCGSARDRWEKYRKLCAAVSDHGPMEQVDALFEALEVYARYRDAAHFSDCCTQLAAMIRAIAEAQAVNWWNLLTTGSLRCTWHRWHAPAPLPQSAPH